MYAIMFEFLIQGTFSHKSNDYLEKSPIFTALRAWFSADKGLMPNPLKMRFYCVINPQQKSNKAMVERLIPYLE